MSAEVWDNLYSRFALMCLNSHEQCLSYMAKTALPFPPQWMSMPWAEKVI